MRIIPRSSSLLLLIALSGCQTTSGSESAKRFEDGKRVLTASTCLSRNHEQVKTLKEHFLYSVNTTSKMLKIRFKDNAKGNSRSEQADSHSSGEIDLILCPNGYYADRVPAIRLAVLSNKLTKDIRENGGLDFLQSTWIKGINARILVWPAADAYKINLYLKRVPSLSKKTGINLSGLRIRANALHRPFIEAMGAVPKSVPMRNIKSALAGEQIDGFVFPNGNISRRGWDEYINVRIDPGFYRPSMMLTINNDTFKSLSKVQQKELTLVAQAYEKASNIDRQDHVTRDTDVMRVQGIQLMRLKGDHARAFIATVHNVQFKRLKSEFDIESFDRIKNFLYRP